MKLITSKNRVRIRMQNTHMVQYIIVWGLEVKDEADN